MSAHMEGGARKRGQQDDPRVSVVTVVFNGAATIAEAIESVAGQQGVAEHTEHIVVDGGSTDGTVDILRRYDQTLGYWVSEPDDGIYDAMNKGIALARGAIVGILNADDSYTQDAVALACRALDEHPEAGYCYGWMSLCDEDGRPIGVVKPVPRRLFPRRFLRETPLPHPTMFVRRNVYEEHGVFDATLRLAGDFELIARFHLRGVQGVEIPAVMARFRTGGASSSARILTEQRQVAIRYGARCWIAWIDWSIARLAMAVKRRLPARAKGWLREFKQRVFLRNP